jgi:MarR family transcriptional regulator for hemolysin
MERPLPDPVHARLKGSISLMASDEPMLSAASPTSHTSEEARSLSVLPRNFMEAIPRSMWAIRQAMRDAAGQDFSVPQFRVMAALMSRPRTNGELSEELGVSVPAMSRMVDGLVAAGYVIRVPQERDRRQIRLELSPDGRRTFKKIQKQTQATFGARFSELDEKSRGTLADGLAVLLELFS